MIGVTCYFVGKLVAGEEYKIVIRQYQDAIAEYQKVISYYTNLEKNDGQPNNTIDPSTTEQGAL